MIVSITMKLFDKQYCNRFGWFQLPRDSEDGLGSFLNSMVVLGYAADALRCNENSQIC